MKWSRCNQSFSLLVWVLSVLAHVSLFLILFLSPKSPLIKTRKLQTNISWKAPETQKKAPNPHKNKLRPSKSHQLAKRQELRREPALISEEYLNIDPGLGSEPKAEIIIRKNPLLVNGQAVDVPYPPIARAHRIEGKVRMRLIISQNGQVLKAEVLSCPSNYLLKAAHQAVRELLFLPATDNFGVAQMAEVEHDVVFRLNKRS